MNASTSQLLLLEVPPQFVFVVVYLLEAVQVLAVVNRVEVLEEVEVDVVTVRAAATSTINELHVARVGHVRLHQVLRVTF